MIIFNPNTFLNWSWYKDTNTTRLFLHLLLTAETEDTIKMGVALKKGQLLTTLALLSEQTEITNRELRTCTDRLKMTNDISTQATNKYTIVTICNYEQYEEKKTTKDKRKRSTNDKQNNKQDGGTVYTRCMAIYNDFVIKQTGVKALIDSYTGKSLNKIIAYFRTLDNGKNDEEVVKAFTYLFENYLKWEAFYQKQIKLGQIESNLINIINSIKNGRQNGSHQSDREKRNTELGALENLATSILQNTDLPNSPAGN